ncbi:MAG: proton-conducting transporter membrane subunit [Bacteroidota bacterium]|nr:proton-conducting transporter membrane subunit [Bacteroidota bacterium]
MESLLIEIFNLLALVAMGCFLFFKTKGRGLITLGVITIQVIISSVVAFSVFSTGLIEYSYSGSWITEMIPVRIDFLSAWFILIISFTFLTGAWYGIQYMKKYIDQADNITLHAVAFILVYTSLIDICIVQNGFVLLVVWEIMALSSFVVVIFEHNKAETLKAGINFLIQSHVSILFLTIAFMWVRVKTGSFDFSAITAYTSTQPAITGIGLFIFFFIGFAIKAGFVPFHTWLPLAHPAAPAHISGVMSGVIIKIGIYGILRVLLLIKTDLTALGYFILTISVITGIYGVMLAIVQHNLKKLLAYHSIENIGIIGIGIGLGCLGIGYNNQILLVCGFGGALLHTLNHSLFKSLLFYGAGNVYQARHTMDIEALGGLIKRMPRSAFLFLIGSLAICGFPPFNGFVSEFFIYNGLFKGLLFNNFMFTLFVLFAILGLVIIGGLALLCFTKAFGIVFLGTPREKIHHDDLTIERPLRIVPMYAVALVIILIGIFPLLFTPWLQKIIQLYQPSSVSQTGAQLKTLLDNLTLIGWYSIGFIGVTALCYFIRHLIISRRSSEVDVTWGCGYTGETDKMQYTASSFIRTYRKLAEPLLSIKKEKQDASGLYPHPIRQVTHPGDKVENWLIDKPVSFIKRFLNRFVFLQNGNIQAYILYGFVFVGLAILFPLILDKIVLLMNFLKQL